MARPELAAFKSAITEHGGVITEIAKHFGKSCKTIYNWLDSYDLRDYLNQSRVAMRDVSEDVMYQVLVSEPEMLIHDIEKKRRLSERDKFLLDRADKALGRKIKVAQFTLQNTNQAGQFISVSDETLRLMRVVGLSIEDASSIFEEMVREAARQKQLVA